MQRTIFGPKPSEKVRTFTPKIFASAKVAELVHEHENAHEQDEIDEVQNVSRVYLLIFRDVVPLRR